MVDVTQLEVGDKVVLRSGNTYFVGKIYKMSSYWYQISLQKDMNSRWTGVVTYTPDGASNLFGEDETDIVEIIKKVPYPLMQSESFGEF